MSKKDGNNAFHYDPLRRGDMVKNQKGYQESPYYRYEMRESSTHMTRSQKRAVIIALIAVIVLAIAAVLAYLPQ